MDGRTDTARCRLQSRVSTTKKRNWSNLEEKLINLLEFHEFVPASFKKGTPVISHDTGNKTFSGACFFHSYLAADIFFTSSGKCFWLVLFIWALKTLQKVSSFFLVTCSRARDYTTRYDGRSVGRSVGWSVVISFFSVFGILGVFCITAPAQMLESYLGWDTRIRDGESTCSFYHSCERSRGKTLWVG